jgi:cytochrome b subunit of formate dehydrogenase
VTQSATILHIVFIQSSQSSGSIPAQHQTKEIEMSKTKLNYLLDAVIAFAFVMSALSGIVFLFAGSGGYQGGRNPSFRTEILGVSRDVWSNLHTWVSLVMIAGVVIHLVLHWNWIVCMTKRVVRELGSARPGREQETCPTA